jgi:hypothetical protein
LTDREEAGLRGRVKNCIGEIESVYPDRQRAVRTQHTFSAQGNLLEQRHQNPDGSYWSIVCRYDERGRMVAKEQPKQRFSYLYDSLGRLERVLSNTDQGGERVIESVQYAPDGTKTSTSYPPPLSDTQRRSTGVMLHASLDAVAIMTSFDSSDRPIRKVLYDADDRVIRRVAFRYAEDGLLLEEGELIGGSIREDFRNVYRYDDLGRRIEVAQRWGDFGGLRLTLSYNGSGDIVEKIIEQHTGILREDDDTGSHSWTERFTHHYDDLGNWIKRTTETISQAGEVRRSMIEQRELTYY